MGRYVLAEPLPGSTTLHRVSEEIEKQFGIGRELHANFTIFPQAQTYQSNSTEDGIRFPYWHDRPLPHDTTISEAQSFDVDAARELVPADVPVVHLVLETKAGALSRIVGTKLVTPDQDGPWNRLESFHREFSSLQACEWWRPDLVNALTAWRHARYAHEYLESQRRKRPAPKEGEAKERQDPRVEKLQLDKLEAKVIISALADQWTNWVLGQQSVQKINELSDDEVEATVQRIWRKNMKLSISGKCQR